jgi:hypothetical protein
VNEEVCSEKEKREQKNQNKDLTGPPLLEISDLTTYQIEMRRPVSCGMRYAPNDRRARGAIEKETGYEKD